MKGGGRVFLAETLIWYLKNFVFRAYGLRSGIVVLAVLLYAAAAAAFIWRLCCLGGKPKARGKRLRLALGLLWAALGLCTLLPYTDARTKTAEPELVALVQTEEAPDGWVYYIHELYIHELYRWPFSYRSLADGYQPRPKALEELLPYVQEPDKYTYIISYGQKLNGLQWNIWESWDSMLPPWHGRIMEPAAESVEPPDDNIYIYRVAGVHLEPYG